MPPSSLQDVSSLADAMQKHLQQERVSFHTPGHKGFSWQADGSFARDSRLEEDLTELPGLDQLAYPDGVIDDLEKRAAQIWGAESTLISVNGASAGIVAAIIMLAKRGTHLLVPRNCHRSVIHGLILSGLQPIWFEPEWDEEWGFWGAPLASSLESVITEPGRNKPRPYGFVGNRHLDSGTANFADTVQAEKAVKIAGMVITSPTYAGALADIKSIAELAGKHDIPLIVDEAQGAHLLWSENHKQAALNSGADIVIHSLHKTLSCPTQTGLVHLTKKAVRQYGFSASELRACMTLIQSSSPSYLFMSAIDKLVTALGNGKAQQELARVENLGRKLQQSLAGRKGITVYRTDCGTLATDTLIKHNHYNPQELQELLIAKGIFPEAIIGHGLLFFLGIGSQENDINILLSELDQIQTEAQIGKIESISRITIPKPGPIEQVHSPREAFFMPSQMVPIRQAIGQVSAECRAPCPPGWPNACPWTTHRQ